MSTADRSPHHPPASPSRGASFPWLRSLIVRIVVLALFWIILSGANPKTWPLSVMVILATAYVSLRTIPRASFGLSIRGIAGFLPFFLFHSARGGMDVAARAMRGSPRLDPGTVAFTTALPRGPSRTFFVAVLGLQPGTLTARLDGDQLRVHVLDRGLDVAPQLRAIEARVAALFDLPLRRTP